jgi:hypothetical protein
MRPFTKPTRFERRRGADSQPQPAARSREPRSLIRARGRAAQQNVSVDQLLIDQRTRLRASTYPSPDCFEPYELDQHAGGTLPAERKKHADVCEGCRVLLSSATASPDRVAAFLDEVDEIEIESEASPAWEFGLEAVGAAAAFVAVVGFGCFAFRFIGPGTSDPSSQAALRAQVTALAPLPIMIAAWGLGVWTLGTLVTRYTRDLLQRAGGAVSGAAVVGTVVVLLAWQNTSSLAASMRTAVAFAQTQLAAALAADGGPSRLAGLTAAPSPLQTSSPFITVTAATPQNGPQRVSSNVYGLPGSVVAEMQPAGGNVYWEIASQKQKLGYFVYGSVDRSRADEFVLTDATNREHVIKKPAGSPDVANGSEVMVFMTPTNEPVSVYPLARPSSPK